MRNNQLPNFHIDFDLLKSQLDEISPLEYIKNRNYLDGDVTKLSPYVSHGIISTRDIAAKALNQKVSGQAKMIEGFIFQLAWRDFFHRVWEREGDEIFQYLHQSQLSYGCIRGQIPKSIIQAKTGIKILDTALKQLYNTGYIHNHARMWLAFVVANLAHTDWTIGAKWMYYHLLDGDLASNSLSWQWVAGTFSKKQYIANQENLNKYALANSSQKGTFLDMSYEKLAKLETPKILLERVSVETEAPSFDKKTIQDVIAEILASKNTRNSTVFLRSMFHLDPSWHAGESGKHVVLIEPRWLEKFPISAKRIDFIQHWVTQIQAQNLNNVDIVVANFRDFVSLLPENVELFFQQHNACQHWQHEKAHTENYPWLFPDMAADYPSFFSFWKKAKKRLNDRQWQTTLQSNFDTSIDIYAA